MNSLRIGMVGLTGALAGFVLQGCLAAQPGPECQVTTGNVLYGITNYMMVLTETAHTGASCPDMKSMEVGLERFQPLDGGYTLGVRPARLVDMAMGKVFEADTDLSNDCTKPAQGCGTCVPVIQPPNLNVCKVTLEPIALTDPADPDGLNLTTIVPFPHKPVNGLCAVPEVTVSQNFAAVPLPLADGGTTDFPALPTKLVLKDFNLLMTSSVPGIAFTAKMHYTEGSDCTADYDVLGLWPIRTCAKDIDCTPVADIDAGIITGSGINPTWKPVCNADIGLCVPSVDLTKLQ